MARLERIKHRLNNWAMWKSREASGGLGYATRSVLLSDVWCRGSYNGMVIPVLEQDAEETNLAVESLKLTRSHLYVTLDCIYLKDLGIKATARRMLRAESTIKLQLEQADHAIAQWLEERATEREKQRVQEALSAQRAKSA